MAIRLLAPDTIGKIAAGEVIERPASVVKELVENALDAGARRIAVRIAGGGIELIEVTDDGSGIPPDELPLALERHATSKLSRFEDLHQLGTLGFRGEALPSIAAVSRLDIRTRVREQPSGAALTVDFGTMGRVQATAAPLGTTVTVRQLFANVPARRKFLRQPATESGLACRVVEAYALAYPEVAFSLETDGRRVFTTDGSGDLVATATAILGAEVGRALLTLEPLDESAAVPGVDVTGWVAAPSISRSHRQGIVFFVNGRWIQNRALSYALEEAYHSLLMVGRHPVALARIQLDPASVDVNVHPTKAEVKFADERAVCRAVQRAAHAALVRAPRDELPGITFQPPPPRERTDQLPMAPIRTEPLVSSDETETETQDRPETHPSGLPILRVLGQVAASYIIAEGPEGLYLIDQHAAHERVMYEKILAQLAAKSVDQQPLLDPLVIELSPEELAVFEKSLEEFRQIGFDCEPFGHGSAVIRAIPAIIQGVDIAERFRLMLRELADGGVGTSWLDSVAITAACHSSIRAGQPLSLAEMRELVAQLERTQHPRACGHGRPTMLQLSAAELERQFARR